MSTAAPRSSPSMLSVPSSPSSSSALSRPMAALVDASTLTRRSLIRAVRYPSMTLLLIGLPLIFLLLFVYVFGGTLGAGLPGGPVGGAPDPGSDRAAYLGYVVPGILALGFASAAQGAAISAAIDNTGGLLTRLRTMSVSRGAVIAGHVAGNTVQAVLGAAVLVALALALGYRPQAGPLDWLAVIGLIVLAAATLIWLGVALGLAAPSVETASNTPMILTLLPFLGSGFVPTAAMPGPVRWFAEHQPMTPVIETIRELLAGRAVGATGLVAIGWCVALILLSQLLATRRLGR